MAQLNKLNAAWESYRSGDLTGAEQGCYQALAVSPGNAAALGLLGILRLTAGQTQEAVDLLARAVKGKPRDAVFLGALGLARLMAGDAVGAEPALRGALRWGDREDAMAHMRLGMALGEQGKHVEAVAELQRALRLAPGSPEVMLNLANALAESNALGEAESLFNDLLLRAPTHADARYNLGTLYTRLGRLDDAAAQFHTLLQYYPGSVDGRNGLGVVFERQGQLDKAEAAWREALTLDENHAPALNNLGDLLRARGAVVEAAQHYTRAMRALPTQADGYRNMGFLHAQQGQYEQACSYLERAVVLDMRSNAARIKLAEMLKVCGRFTESASEYKRLLSQQAVSADASAGLMQVRQHMCDWAGIEKLWEAVRLAIRGGTDAVISPFSVLSMPTTAQEQRACARIWAGREFSGVAERPALHGRSACRRVDDRLKVGYLSWDYHEHATAYLMAEVFELHDRNRFCVTAYSYGPNDSSAIRQRIRNACESFVDVAALSDADAARRIADDGIDILIDLKGYTLGARTAIMAYRPAPVQVNWLGFPGTMGTECIDWILADRFIIPEGAEGHYQERVYRLPDCYQPNDRRREVAEAPTREACGLPETGVVFCCFNQSYKILPETFTAWMRILTRVPGSVLWLLETNPWAMKNLRANAVSQGVAVERIIFAPRKPLAEHLARYRVADLALDTFPYTSHTTASDALWAGCPLVARVGDTFASRVSGSVLNAARMPELVTDTVDQFEELAVQLALAPERRTRLREQLIDGQTNLPLFDTPRFVANLEQAYQAMCP